MRVADGGSGGAEGHLARACRARHLDDLLRGRAANDGVVDDEHVLAEKLAPEGVELLPDGFLALRLPGHDEGATDVAVLEETLAVLDAELLRDLHRGGPGGVRNGHDDVDVT